MHKAQLLFAMIVGVLTINGCGGMPGASQEPVPYSPGPDEEIVTAVVAPVPGSDHQDLTIVTRLD